MPTIKRVVHYSSVAVLQCATLLLLLPGFTPVFNSFMPKDAQKVMSNTIVTNDTQKVLYLSADSLKPTISGTPVQISIPSLSLDKQVIDGIYDPSTQTWNVSDEDIHYALLSEPVNNKAGNTLLYAHNNKYAFGPLEYMDLGSEAIVKTENGSVFTYKYIARQDFQPEDTSIITNDGSPRLVLQTCTGFLNQIRTMYIFDLVEVIKA